MKKLALVGWLVFIFILPVMAMGKTELQQKQERMLEDSFSFFRANIRSFYDYALAHKPQSAEDKTLMVQLHGDPHLENFGLWGDEKNLNFGLIDFEETCPGPFYIDIERLGVGLILASRAKGIYEEKVILSTLAKGYLNAWLKLKNGEDLPIKESSPLVKKVWQRGEQGTRLGLLSGYGSTALNEKGERIFKPRANLLPLDKARIEPALSNYLESLPLSSRQKKEFYGIKDAVEARGIGLGSLGNLKYRLLLEGPSLSQDDDYILELREAKEPPLPTSFVDQARRVYEAQKTLQNKVPPFLGFTQFEGRDFLVDEIYPHYSTVKEEDLKELRDFLNMAEAGGMILAEAHFRTNKDLDKAPAALLEETGDIILDYSYLCELKTLASRLKAAKEKWLVSLEDKYSEEELARVYKEMQAYCRNFLKKYHGFKTEEMQSLAEEVRYPYEVYYNDLFIEANKFKEQLFNITTPGTLAQAYYQRPSERNLANLKALFDRIYQYYIGKSYSWNRYLNKYLFQKSRLEHYLKEWNLWEEEYRLSGTLAARERLEFCYKRLKKEMETNNLPEASEVNALYLSHNLEEYYGQSLQQEELSARRKEKGYEKEVVILIHGLGGDRSSWKELPRLLAREDAVNPDLKKFFKVYLFRFDTIEDSKSVANFARELSGFIREVQKREGAGKVNIISHSLGGVITLKYLAKNTDPDFDLRPLEDEERPLLTVSSGRNNVKRFIGLAPSLSGSKVANVIVTIFKKPEAWFEENIKAINKGSVPSKGDIQVKELQLGSSINLDSFRRINMERALEGISTMTIIGLPPQELSKSEDNRRQKEYRPSENDGLVAVYSANINHHYFKGSNTKEDIGYQKAAVRYLPLGHFELMAITSREHPSYKYIVSFLNDRLELPKEETALVKTFGVLLRVSPGDAILNTLPGLEIEWAKDNPGLSPGLTRQDKIWNTETGAYFEQGSFGQSELKDGSVVYLLKAKGYKTKIIVIPVTRGQISYAPHIILNRE